MDASHGASASAPSALLAPCAARVGISAERRHTVTMVSTIDPAEWIESAARDQPHRLFLKTPTGRELSYASLRDQSGRFAAALMRRGAVTHGPAAPQVDKSVEAPPPSIPSPPMGALFLPTHTAKDPNARQFFP